MNQDLYAQSIEYELLTQTIYQAVLLREGQNIEVDHNVRVRGRSGVEHQIDVLWRFNLAQVAHTVLIECKNHGSPLSLQHVRNFFAVVHDVGNCIGVMVAKTGYQSGTQRFAEHYGIALKRLGQPMHKNWEGRVRTIRASIQARGPVSTPECPIRLQLHLEADDAVQKRRLRRLDERSRLSIPSGPDLVLWSRDRGEATEEVRWWLPRILQSLERKDGGPYRKSIPLEQKYVLINPGEPDEEFVRVPRLDVEFFVKTYDTEEVLIDGVQLVEAILVDIQSGDVEFVRHKEGD